MLICMVATTPYAVNMFLRSRIAYAIKAGHDVIVVTSYDDEIYKLCNILGAMYVCLDIKRRFSPGNDLVALFRLIKIIYQIKPDMIQSITSKAGLLCAITSALLHVRIRCHIYAGLPWVEMEGIKKRIGMFSDKLIAGKSSMTYADSFSQMNYLIEKNICKDNQIRVIGEGSVSGFDLSRFSNPELKNIGQKALKNTGIKTPKIILFVGRVTKDKGICELVECFERIAIKIPDVSLVIAGPFEEKIDPLPLPIKSIINDNERIFYVGYQNKPEIWYSVAELLVLPSYREGFGNVVIEAAIAGVPTVGTNIVGLKDSILNNQTGILVEKKNVEALEKGIMFLLNNDSLRAKMGEAAKKRAYDKFSEKYVNELILEEYESLRLL